MAITDPDTYQRVPLDPDLAERYAKEVGALKAIECQHEQTQFRRGFNKGGGPIVKKQCLSCGLLVGNPVKRTPETDLLEHDELFHLESAEDHHHDKRGARDDTGGGPHTVGDGLAVVAWRSTPLLNPAQQEHMIVHQ